MKMKNLIFACAFGLIGNSCMGMNNVQNPNNKNCNIFFDILKAKQEKMLSSIKANMPPLTNWNVIITTTLVNRDLLAMSVKLEDGYTFREIAGLMNRYPTHEEYIYRTLYGSDIRKDNIVFGRALHMIMSRCPETNTRLVDGISALFTIDDARDRNRNLLPPIVNVLKVGAIDEQLRRIAFLCNNPTIDVEIAVLLYNNPEYKDYITQVLLDSDIIDTHVINGVIMCNMARMAMQN